MRLKLIAIAVSGLALAAGTAACGDSDPASTTRTTATTIGPGVKPVAEIDQVDGRSTAVALDAAFLQALDTLKLKPAPIPGATLSDDGVITFPINGGHVRYYTPGSATPYVQGRIDHYGSGLSLTSGNTVVELTNFIIDPGQSLLTGTVTVNGKVAASSAPLFFLDGRTLQPLQIDSSASTATLSGTTVELKQSAADLLNRTFRTTALKGGLVVGVATITLNTD